jgi:hypothetical protein
MIETGSTLLFGGMSVILLVTTVYLFWVNRDSLFGHSRKH